MTESDCVLKLKVLRPTTQKGDFDERIFKNAIERAIGGKAKSVEWAICVDKLGPKNKKDKKKKKTEEEEKKKEKEVKEAMTEEAEEEEAEKDSKVHNVAVKFINEAEAEKMRAHISKGKGAMGCKLEILDMEEDETEKFLAKCTSSMRKAKINSKKIRKETKEVEAESLKKFSKHIEIQRKILFGENLKRKAQPMGKKKGKKPKRK